MKKVLTFEMDPSQDILEIYFDKEGLDFFINELSKLRGSSSHIHMMTPSWGGHELSEEIQGQRNSLLNHVKIFSWQNGVE